MVPSKKITLIHIAFITFISNPEAIWGQGSADQSQPSTTPASHDERVPQSLDPREPLKPGEVRVLSLQMGGVPSNSSYGRLLSPFPELRDFTVCYRIRLNRFREESTLMSYAISEGKDNELRMDHRISGYKVSLHSIWAKTKQETPLRYWSHFCFRYGFFTGKWAIFMNGELTDEGTFPVTTSPLEGNGTYIIGQEQDSLGGGFQRDQSYSGEITQLNFWSRELDHDIINKIALCQELEEGDALPWTAQSWQIHGNMAWKNLPTEAMCTQTTRELTIFPDRFFLDNALHLCKILGGILSVPQTAAENAWVFSTSKDRAQYCSGNVGASFLWLGANDKNEEGVWRYHESKEELKWQSAWRGDGPNGGTVENCLVMLSGSFPARWSDIACLETYAFCVPCEFEKKEVLYLKGPAVCQGSPFNLQYLLGEERGGRPSLSGFLHSDIFWDDDLKAWVMQSLKQEGIATWKPSEEGMYPFGTHLWTLGSKVCDMLKGETVNLTISTCGRGKFTCYDGSCIDLSQRCDLRVDCPDESDEAKCSLVDVPAGYRMTIPPPPTMESQPLPIRLEINIISFPSIETEALTFVTSLQLRLRWQDTRLTYLNLKDDRSLNVLSRTSTEKIWKPKVFFSNAQGNIFTNMNEGSQIDCIRSGNSTEGPPQFAEEVNLFSGRENSLEMSQLYSVTYTCDFDLLMFPFDAQVCGLRFTLVSATTSYMDMFPGNATYTGPPNLIEYYIGRVDVRKETEGEFASVLVRVRFIRRYGFYMLTLYIPTTLLIITAYATFFFNPYDFNSRIVVALTSLLVLSSLYTQTSNSLPKTSYFKLVDIWLFFSIVMIFIVVLLQTLIDFSEQVKVDQNSLVNRIMAKLFGKKLKPFSRSLILPGGGELSSPVEYFNQKQKNDGIQIQVNEQGNSQDETKGKDNCWENNSDPKQVYAAAPGPSPYLRGQYIPGQTAEVNVPMMSKSRLLIPFIFVVFNGAYWGTAIRHLRGIESADADADADASNME